MAEVLRVDARHPDPDAIAYAAACLRRGGLVAFPTETVYGLGADATNQRAVQRIFDAKARPANDPLIVHVANAASVAPLVSAFPAIAARLAEEFWPGPLTLVLPRSAAIADAVTAGLETVGMRVPAHPVALALAEAAGVPIAAPSANLFSRPSPTRAEHVVADLGDRIDVILDSGPTPVGVESTVLDLTTTPPRVLRPGGVSVEALRALLPDVAADVAKAAGAVPMPAPGMLDRHYAPRTPLWLVEGDAPAVIDRAATEIQAAMRSAERVALLGTREMLRATEQALGDVAGLVTIDLGSQEDPGTIAAELYVNLRACDASHVDRVVALQLTSDRGVARAVRDRLRRAASGRIIRC